MSCIESGKLMLQYENASLKQLISKMSSIVEHELEEKNLRLNINLDELQDDSIICDTLRVNQIFLNLLSNAIKY